MAGSIGPGYDFMALPSGRTVSSAAVAEAIEEVRRAVLDAGARPDYHHAQAERLRREWPTLWRAVEHLVQETGGR